GLMEVSLPERQPDSKWRAVIAHDVFDAVAIQVSKHEEGAPALERDGRRERAVLQLEADTRRRAAGYSMVKHCVYEVVAAIAADVADSDGARVCSSWNRQVWIEGDELPVGSRRNKDVACGCRLHGCSQAVRGGLLPQGRTQGAAATASQHHDPCVHGGCDGISATIAVKVARGQGAVIKHGGRWVRGCTPRGSISEQHPRQGGMGAHEE